MKFKTVLLCSVFSLGLIGNVKSAELTVVGDETLTENKEYNGNAGSGIYAMGVDAIVDSNYISRHLKIQILAFL